VNIREAQEPDAAIINAIYNATVRTTTVAWTEEHERLSTREAWLEEQRHLGNPILVALRDDHVVGFASYDDFGDATKWPGYRFTVEHPIHIHQDHQGEGVGGALLDTLMARAAGAGKHVMIGAVDGENAGSIRFHERHGFAVTGRLPQIGFKFGRWLDLVLMQRMLPQRPSTGAAAGNHRAVRVHPPLGRIRFQ
jgi:L-amino acid N-acyltransferase YncA